MIIPLEPDIVEIMKKAVNQLEHLYTIVHEYDWMISGDTSPETFRERVGLQCELRCHGDNGSFFNFWVDLPDSALSPDCK
jgi:hypothetical protein